MHFSSLHSWFQALTRVSISRNSRREMTHSFPSQAGEVDFHISFSSRVSRFWEQKFSFSSRFSRSFIKIIFLLSIFKILKTDFSFSSQFVKYRYWESLSVLDFQDYFLFSPINILKVQGPSHAQLLGGRPSACQYMRFCSLFLILWKTIYLVVWGVITRPSFGTPHHHHYHHHHNKKSYTCDFFGGTEASIDI